MTGIVTVTAAAAIDQTYVLPELSVGAVNRADSVHREVSGKGVNVARAVELTGHRVSAVLALGELDLPMIADIDFSHIMHAVTVPGHARLNTTIIEKGGHTTKVNQAPAPMAREHWVALRDLAIREVDRLDADWLVLCGSMPSLAESGEVIPLLELIDLAEARGTRVAVDTSGLALDLVVGHLEKVALIKPNTHELSAVVHRDVLTIRDVIGAAEELRARGVETVYVSMGEDGALAVAENGVWWARATAAKVVNSAGAGDASLAGFLVNALRPALQTSGTGSPGERNLGDSVHGLAAPLDIPGAICAAASWGALAVSQQTTLLSALEDAPAAELVESPDPTQKLRDPAWVAGTNRTSDEMRNP